MTAPRPVPGTSLALSPLALTVGSARGPLEVDAVVAALRRARAQGVTTFDTVGSLDPAVAEALVAAAFPEGDPEVVVLTRPHRRSGGPGPPSPDGLVARPSPTTPFPTLITAGRLRPGPRSLPQVDAADLLTVGGPGPPSAVEGALVARCRTVEEVLSVPPLSSPALLSGAVSLLDRQRILAAARRFGPSGFVWIARDPFAGGRLDGSRFLPAGAVGVGQAPTALRALENDFASVAPLGFLGRPGQRTLAQAALRYLSRLPYVASVVVDLPSPERWDEILGFERSPVLDAAELARIEQLAPEDPRALAPGGLA